MKYSFYHVPVAKDPYIVKKWYGVLLTGFTHNTYFYIWYFLVSNKLQRLQLHQLSKIEDT